MIYEGKEYIEVVDGEIKVGELLHITVLAGMTCDAFRVVTKIESDGDILVNIDLPNRVDFVREEDTFKRYRYVKDVEETTTNVFKEGDRVEVVGYNGTYPEHFNGGVGKFMDVNDFGECSVLFDHGFQLPFSPESLKLVEETLVPMAHANKIQELARKVESSPITLANAISDAVSNAQREALKGISINRILSENIDVLFAEIKDIIVAKNENYGDSFSKQYQKYGMISVEMRLNDKFMRLEQLVAGEKDKVGESIEDTLKDIIGYATLALIELEGENSER